MRVAVVDIGTNSTRLLVVEVEPGGPVHELDRRSTVTRLGEGVDGTGRLGDEPMARVLRALDAYRAAIDEHGAQATTAVLTSAVRDAANGGQFTEAVRERYGLEARTISGEEEAALTFAGATAQRARDGTELVVFDVGGGSTELVTGRDGRLGPHVSVPAGVVRQSERHLRADPPRPDELAALVAEARGILEAALPADVRERVGAGVAVGGTATSAARIELAAREGTPPQRTHGHAVRAEVLDDLLARVAALTNEQRRALPGLHPDRAPTIVAGIAILRECLRAFALPAVEVSEQDILLGAALARAASVAGRSSG
ncbi:MAG: Ppx/GppA family phosphatase [Actinomycetota bacterium]|nr:Ppx/GppA family phosphatase [Actinomycetota bacterium]